MRAEDTGGSGGGMECGGVPCGCARLATAAAPVGWAALVSAPSRGVAGCGLGGKGGAGVTRLPRPGGAPSRDFRARYLEATLPTICVVFV